MLKKLLSFFLLMLVLAPSIVSVAQEPQGLPVDVPREEMVVLDQIFRYGVAGNYNIWTPSGLTPHRHTMMNETLWYRDQETGERINGVASSDPVYNDDYTQMSVDLRENLTWSDGVPFTADDLVYTVETLMATPELGIMGWNASLNTFVDSVEKTGDYSVQFNLKESNSRFHTFFETGWNGVYMMPKHIFENVEDKATFTFENPVVLGTYIPTQFDPNGFWELYQRRDDWENSPAGVITGNPGPKYVLTIFYGDSARKAIAMSRGELDAYFDADIEAFQTTLDTTPTARSWYKDFPWAYPNENNTRQFIFNYEDPLFQDARVRWALALSLNIVDLQTEYVGGVVKVTAIPIPPTQALQPLFHDPMEEWLTNLEIDLGDGTMYKPYDPTVPDQIAAWAEEQGYTVPGTPREVFGTGWWKYDTEAAAKLLESAGYTRNDNGDWMTPDGERFSIEIQSPPDENDAFRMANAATDMWKDFGIDVTLSGLERNAWDQNGQVGQFQIQTPWVSAAQVDGDSWPVVRAWDPKFYVPVGESVLSGGGQDYIQRMRLQDPKWTEYIDAMAPLAPGSEESLAATRDFLEYMTENMQMITAISFKKFVTWDERYWTGFPTAENPNYMPLYWFQGGKFAIQNLRSTNS